MPAPSPLTAPDTLRPPLPALLPAFADNFQVDSPAGSALRSSANALHTSTRSVQEPARPAPRIVHGRIGRADIRPRSHSNPPATGDVPWQAGYPGCASESRTPVPAPLPSAPRQRAYMRRRDPDRSAIALLRLV